MESYDNHPPLMLPVTGTRVQFDNLPTSERFLDLFNRVKNIGNSPQPYLKETVIAPSSVDDVLVGVRQQPEGREKTISDVTSYDGTTSSPEALSSKAINSATPARSNHSNHHLNDTASVGGVGRIVSSSSCSSSSSEPEGYSRLKKRQSQRGSVEKVSPSQAINALIKSDPKADSVEERGKDCDDLLLLPVSETHSVPSQVGRNKHEGEREPREPSFFPRKKNKCDIWLTDIHWRAKQLPPLNFYSCFSINCVCLQSESLQFFSSSYFVLTRPFFAWRNTKKLNLAARRRTRNAERSFHRRHQEGSKRVGCGSGWRRFHLAWRPWCVRALPSARYERPEGRHELNFVDGVSLGVLRLRVSTWLSFRSTDTRSTTTLFDAGFRKVVCSSVTEYWLRMASAYSIWTITSKSDTGFLPVLGV